MRILQKFDVVTFLSWNFDAVIWHSWNLRGDLYSDKMSWDSSKFLTAKILTFEKKCNEICFINSFKGPSRQLFFSLIWGFHYYQVQINSNRMKLVIKAKLLPKYSPVLSRNKAVGSIFPNFYWCTCKRLKFLLNPMEEI